MGGAGRGALAEEGACQPWFCVCEGHVHLAWGLSTPPGGAPLRSGVGRSPGTGQAQQAGPSSAPPRHRVLRSPGSGGVALTPVACPWGPTSPVKVTHTVPPLTGPLIDNT